ncbi:MAG: HlyD family type I secretion periplasmic adaptor subunit [Burkholderiales bacterium]
MNTPSESAAPRHPALDLLARYRAIFGAVWAVRRELAGPKRLADEAAFLPAALSLQETPVHPAPRRFALAICALFVIALVWSVIGHVDIVAVAPGRIVVSERTKKVQPLETSVVREVLVKDGDSVRARQVLVELDATNATADGANVQEQLASAQSEELRTTTLIEALRAQRFPSLPPGAHATVSAQLNAEWQDIAARLSKLDAEQARRQAELATVRETIAKLDATLPMARQRETDFKALTDQGFMSGHAGQDRTRERIEQERDLATQQARLAEAQAASRETTQARAAYLAETQRSLSERQAQAILRRQQFTQELNKAQQRSRLTQLTAPVDGTVQQVAVHTEGGVVTEAQVLMVIVPKDAEVTAEVVIDNKDIGFVNAGQHTTIKLETFPYTRYGTVEATVSSVTADAVNDEKRGAIFPATLKLAQTHIDVDGKRIGLSPGMNVTAEIRTGQRRVIDYLLSPIQKTVGESLRER